MDAPPSLLHRPGRLFAGYAFDLDGTLYLGDELLPGAARLLAVLRELGRRVVFVSNNPTRTLDGYVEKLGDLGIEVAEREVVNTVQTTVRWLSTQCPGARVFALAEEPLRDALRAAGVPLCEDPERIDVVVASFDRTLDYAKLQVAFDALWRRPHVRFVATNPDHYCPVPGGGQPDAGALVAALEVATGRRLECHFGKPGRVMTDAVLERLDLPGSECVIVGDRTYTDVAAARTAGMSGALVLTGETDAEAAACLEGDERPDFVLARVDELLPVEEWRARGWEDSGS